MELVPDEEGVAVVLRLLLSKWAVGWQNGFTIQ
jgi:hypothetical protein